MSSPTLTKRVGIIQSSYIPWRGYFDFINSVDVFVIYDDVQYSKGSWRNRNQLKTANGLIWLTVPVKYQLGIAIDQTEIATLTKSWRESHQTLLKQHLGTAPFFQDAIDIWQAGVAGTPTTISQLNIQLIQMICDYLGIKTPLVRSRDYALTGAKTERLIQLLQHLNATTYLSGPAAQDYLDETLFQAHGIGLEYKTYNYLPYPQLWGDFVGTVTILDLIANTGPDAKHWLSSQTENQVVVAARTS